MNPILEGMPPPQWLLDQNIVEGGLIHQELTWFRHNIVFRMLRSIARHRPGVAMQDASFLVVGGVTVDTKTIHPLLQVVYDDFLLRAFKDPETSSWAAQVWCHPGVKVPEYIAADFIVGRDGKFGLRQGFPVAETAPTFTFCMGSAGKFYAAMWCIADQHGTLTAPAPKDEPQS